MRETDARIYKFKSAESSAKPQAKKEKVIFHPIRHMHARVVAIRARGTWRASFFKPKPDFKPPQRMDIPHDPLTPNLKFSEELRREEKRKKIAA